MQETLDAVRSGDRKAQVRSAARGLKEWAIREEREIRRPGHVFMAILMCGMVLGASLVGLVWLSSSIYSDNHQGTGTTYYPPPPSGPVIDHSSD